MNKIKELIETLCPEGVEFKDLGEVAHYPTKRILANQVNESNYVGVENGCSSHLM
jgi:type I restriction enzyme S subunit